MQRRTTQVFVAWRYLPGATWDFPKRLAHVPPILLAKATQLNTIRGELKQAQRQLSRPTASKHARGCFPAPCVASVQDSNRQTSILSGRIWSMSTRKQSPSWSAEHSAETWCHCGRNPRNEVTPGFDSWLQSIVFCSSPGKTPCKFNAGLLVNPFTSRLLVNLNPFFNCRPSANPICVMSRGGGLPARNYFYRLSA